LQELEKFKFVLDYKIKDFKQQMEPRELELQESKEQISKMEVELGRCVLLHLGTFFNFKTTSFKGNYVKMIIKII
jgi:hypothetical protein